MNILVPSSKLSSEEEFFEKTDIEHIKKTYGENIANIITDYEKIHEIFGPCMTNKFKDFLYLTETSDYLKNNTKTRFFSNNDIKREVNSPITYIFHPNCSSDSQISLSINMGLDLIMKYDDSNFYLNVHSTQCVPLEIDKNKYSINNKKITRYEKAELYNEKNESSLVVRIIPKRNQSYPIISNYVKGDVIIDSAYNHISGLKKKLKEEYDDELKNLKLKKNEEEHQEKLKQESKKNSLQIFTIEELAFCAGIMNRLAETGRKADLSGKKKETEYISQKI